MPDWQTYVRERLPLAGLRPEAAKDVIDDLASQLDEVYREARARGRSEHEAEQATRDHITDWSGLARELSRSRRLAMPALDRVSARAGDAALDGDRRAGLLARLLEHARVALRVRRHAGYFAFAAGTLAVAVGVNLMVFTVVNALWLRPLPFPDADRLVAIVGAPPMLRLSPERWAAFELVAGQVMTNDSLSGLRPVISLDEGTGQLETLAVTPQYFSVFGLPIRGRDFAEDDDREGAEPVAIISDRVWARYFDRRVDVIGSVVQAQPVPLRIVGVAPPGFAGARRGERADVWIPRALVARVVAPDAFLPQLASPMMVFARLFPGQTLVDAAEQLSVIFPREAQYGRPPTPVPLTDVFGTPDSSTIAIREGNAVVVVGGLAALVLVGGCATLMALVLVHYERRRRELAVRLALGASARRLRADLLRELAVIAAVGAAGAVGASILGLNAIPSLSLPGGVDLGRLDLAIDWRVLSAGLGTTVVSLAAAAALPVSRFTRGRLAGELVAGPAATESASSQRARQVLLALHVAATIVVLVAAGLFVRAVAHGFGAAAGFDPDRVAFVTIELGPVALSGGDASPEEWLQASRDRAARLSEAIGALPGVEAVSTGVSPLSAQLARTVTEPVTVHTQGGEHEMRLGRMWVGAEWLATLGVPILAGRSLTTVDGTSRGAGAPSPAVVTASLARRLWPGDDPVGQVLSGGGGRAGGTYEVVGVTGDFAFGSLVGPATGAIVTVNAMGYGNAPQFVVRTTSPGSLAQAARKIVATLEPSARWMRVETGREIVARDLGRQRLGAWFFSGFGLTALLLGVGGVFGLVAYMADSRRREFGVRLALGATPRDLVRRAMAAALIPVSVGTAAGLVLAALASGVFTSLLTGLSPLDPLTYAAVAMVMLGCAAVAGVVAASRLRRLAPVDTLRAE